MDTMYRKKAKEAEDAVSSAKKQKKHHIADGYSPKLRPRETHPDAIDPEKRISKNLNKLNKELILTPGAKEKQEVSLAEEDRGAKVVTLPAVARAPIPYAFIITCAIIAAVFMYMLSLSIQIEEYSYSIDQIQNEITALKEEATRLEVQLESKFDLDEVERIATQEYGMVSSSTLPKKYVSVAEATDVWEQTEEENMTGLDELIQEVVSLFRSEEE